MRMDLFKFSKVVVFEYWVVLPYAVVGQEVVHSTLYLRIEISAQNLAETQTKLSGILSGQIVARIWRSCLNLTKKIR